MLRNRLTWILAKCVLARLAGQWTMLSHQADAGRVATEPVSNGIGSEEGITTIGSCYCVSSSIVNRPSQMVGMPWMGEMFGISMNRVMLIM